MSRRRAAALQRLALGVVVIVAAAMVLVLVFWLLPSWLTRSADLRGLELTGATADARTALLTVLGALAGLGGLAYTARTYRLSQVGQLTGRFSTASSQMGNADQTVRLAGIHAMAQLADEWSAQRQTCVDVVCAFLRVTGGAPGSESASVREARRTAVRVIARHLGCGETSALSRRPGPPQGAGVSWQKQEFDFSGAVIGDLDLGGVQFTGAHLIFDGAQFLGRVTFDQCLVDAGYLSFREARFLDGCEVSFVGSQFTRGQVAFDGARFLGGEVRFDAARFGRRCEVTFARARLGAGGSVYLRRAQIEGDGLSFANAFFPAGEGEVSFEQSVFHGSTSFRGIRLERDLSFTRVRAALGGADLVFRGAEWVKGRLDFTGAGTTGMVLDLSEPHPGVAQVDLRNPGEGKPPVIRGGSSLAPRILSP